MLSLLVSVAAEAELWPGFVGAVVVVIGLSAQLNSVPIALTSVAAAMATLAVLSPELGILAFFIWLPVANQGKRLLWVPYNATPTPLEFQWVLLLPDLILLATAARVGSDNFVTLQIQYGL